MLETKRTRLPSGVSSAAGRNRLNAKNWSKGGLSTRVSLQSKDGGTAYVAAAEPVERVVRILEREHLDLRPHRHLRRERQELLAVAAGEVRNRTDAALLPQQLVREGGDVAHVNAGADDGAALGERGESGGDERTDGRENDCGVERL